MNEGDPIPPPIPGVELKRLSRRQSIVAWLIGSSAGIALAVGALAAFAPRWI